MRKTQGVWPTLMKVWVCFGLYLPCSVGYAISHPDSKPVTQVQFANIFAKAYQDGTLEQLDGRLCMVAGAVVEIQHAIDMDRCEADTVSSYAALKAWLIENSIATELPQSARWPLKGCHHSVCRFGGVQKHNTLFLKAIYFSKPARGACAQRIVFEDGD